MEGADIIKCKTTYTIFFPTFSLNQSNRSFFDRNFQSTLLIVMFVNSNPQFLIFISNEVTLLVHVDYLIHQFLIFIFDEATFCFWCLNSDAPTFYSPIG
jgi:hypothetical protein